MLNRRQVLSAFTARLVRGQSREQHMFGNAAAYERFMGRWSRLLAPRLVAMTGLRDGGRVLDIGSGTGALTFSIAASKPHCRVVGIDPAVEYVEFAKSRNPFAERVDFEVGDALRLRFPDGMFEASLCLLVLNFLTDAEKALREACRVTKRGGCISAAVWDYGGGMGMLRAFWDAALTVDAAAAKFDEAHMPLCRGGELGQLWKRVGLDRVAQRPLDITTRFTSFADYWDPFCLGQGPAGAWFEGLGGGRREALRSELKRRLAIRSEDAPFSLPARAWAVRGYCATLRKPGGE